MLLKVKNFVRIIWELRKMGFSNVIVWVTDSDDPLGEITNLLRKIEKTQQEHTKRIDKIMATLGDLEGKAEAILDNQATFSTTFTTEVDQLKALVLELRNNASDPAAVDRIAGKLDTIASNQTAAIEQLSQVSESL